MEIDNKWRPEEHDIPKDIKELWDACWSTSDGYYLFAIAMMRQLKPRDMGDAIVSLCEADSEERHTCINGCDVNELLRYVNEEIIIRRRTNNESKR